MNASPGSGGAEHRPLLGFLSPPRDPGPLDDRARQDRWVRVTARGPWRLLLLVPLTLAWISVAAPALVALTAVRSLASLALVVLVLLAVGLPVTAVLVRAWVAGTFVCDGGVKVSTVLRTTAIPWDAVTGVRVGTDRVSWCGTPLRVAGERVVLETAEGPIPTTITSSSPDLWLRPQAWDAARDRVRLWWRESRANA